MELEIKHLSKTYGNGVRALEDVSLTIPTGMFGLLGQNGAGKSTFMRTLATLQEADSGTALLKGTEGTLNILEQREETRKILGYLPQEFGVYPNISSKALLDYLAILKGISNGVERRELVDALLNKVNLWEHRNRAVSGYSGGMKQRFGIAQALIGNPKLIIVDEPTAGLDPGERNRFYNLLAEIGENVIVILSTHIVQDVMELCTNMAIIHQGKLLYSGQPRTAVDALKGKIWERAIDREEIEKYKKGQKVISMKMAYGKPQIHIYSENHPGPGFESTAPDLEDVFFTQIMNQ